MITEDRTAVELPSAHAPPVGGHTWRVLDWSPGGQPIRFLVGGDCAAEVAEELARVAADRVFVVADECPWAAHGGRYLPALRRTCGPVEVFTLPADERRKSLAQLGEILDWLVLAGATRRSVLVAAGGGLIGNLTGMAAALLYRGVRFVHLPTTLLAMHDSATSLKQAVNCAGVKNAVGVYHRPERVFIDLRFLDTLPLSELRGGLAELVKNALVHEDSSAVDLLSACQSGWAGLDWAGVVAAGVRVKNRVLRDDPFERGPAVIFEYGHTVGHALELAHAGELGHGDCVAWGMQAAAVVAVTHGLMAPEGWEAHQALIRLLGPLPVPTRPRPIDDVLRRVQRDNKLGAVARCPAGSVPMVLLHAPARVVRPACGPPLCPVPLDAVRAAVEWVYDAWRTGVGRQPSGAT